MDILENNHEPQEQHKPELTVRLSEDMQSIDHFISKSCRHRGAFSPALGQVRESKELY